MKIAIIGSPNTYESDEIQKYCLKNFDQADKFSLEDFLFTTNDHPQVFYHGEDIISKYDVFLFRGVSENISLAYSIALFAYKKGKTIIDEKYVSQSNLGSKFTSSAKLRMAGLPVPETFETISPKIVREEIVLKLGFPLIAKKAVGSSKGEGVYKVDDALQLDKLLKDNKHSLGKFIFQKYIKSNYDVRVFVVGDQALGAMKRIAKEGDFRSNIAQGGKGEKFDLTREISEIAVKAASAVNNEIAGVDIMFDEKNNPYIIEVNRTPQFKGFDQATGVKAGQFIAKYAFEKANKK